MAIIKNKTLILYLVEKAADFALGKLDSPIDIPEEDNEMTEIAVSMELMRQDLAELIRKQKRSTEIEAAAKEAIKRNHELAQLNKILSKEICKRERTEEKLRESYELNIMLEKSNAYELNVMLERAKIKELNSLIKGQEDERRRVAQDLHDGLGQKLAVLNLNIGILARDESNREEILNNLREASKDAVNEYRSIVHNLRPPSIEDGIVNAISELCSNTLQSFGIKVKFNHDLAANLLKQEQEIELYRVTQELVSNVIKHSGATQINLSLLQIKSSILLIVEDDGMGFDPAGDDNSLKEGIGLKSLRSRISLLGGDIDISSQPSKGTKIMVQIVLKYPGDEKIITV